jgi:hypothetical protein
VIAGSSCNVKMRQRPFTNEVVVVGRWRMRKLRMASPWRVWMIWQGMKSMGWRHWVEEEGVQAMASLGCMDLEMMVWIRRTWRDGTP